MNSLERMPSFLPDHTLNTRKISEIAFLFKSLETWKTLTPSFTPNLPVQHWLNDRKLMSDDELKTKSLFLKPT